MCVCVFLVQGCVSYTKDNRHLWWIPFSRGIINVSRLACSVGSEIFSFWYFVDPINVTRNHPNTWPNKPIFNLNDGVTWIASRLSTDFSLQKKNTHRKKERKRYQDSTKMTLFYFGLFMNTENEIAPIRKRTRSQFFDNNKRNISHSPCLVFFQFHVVEFDCLLFYLSNIHLMASLIFFFLSRSPHSKWSTLLWFCQLLYKS